jgi:hypothetical protein
VASKQELEAQLKQLQETISQRQIEIERLKTESQKSHRRIGHDIIIAAVSLALGIISTLMIDSYFHEITVRNLLNRIDKLEGKISVPGVGPRPEETSPNRTKGVLDKLLPDLKESDHLMILNDFLGYEHYSKPATFSQYIERLREAHQNHRVTIDMIVAGPEAAKEMIKDEFRQKYWIEQGPNDKPGKSGKFGYYDLVDPDHPENQRSFRQYNDYIDYYKFVRGVIDEKKVKTPTTYSEFLNLLTTTQKIWCDDLTGYVNVRTMPYKLAKQPIHFWMIEGKKVLFTFSEFSTIGVGEGRSFTAENSVSQPFLEMLQHRFQALWEPEKENNLALFRQQLNDGAWTPRNDNDFKHATESQSACYEDLFAADSPHTKQQQAVGNNRPVSKK